MAIIEIKGNRSYRLGESVTTGFDANGNETTAMIVGFSSNGQAIACNTANVGCENHCPLSPKICDYKNNEQVKSYVPMPKL